MKSQKLPWFRMYCDFLEDPKILSLAFEDQRHFVGILAMKSSGVLDQSCSEKMMNRIVAQKLWISHDAIDDVKRRLCEAGLIDEDWQPLAWDKRQFVSDRDPTGAERQRRYREKSRNALRDASVTLPDTDTDTDTEKKTKAPGKPARFDPLKVELPACIPADAWGEWIAYRRSRKLTVSEKTMKAQVGKLAEWHAAGHSPASIIATSITNGWQGLFEPKVGGSQAPRDDRHRAHYDRTADNQTMQRQIAELGVQPYDGDF